ncbi:hypothetical protein JQ625_27295 [Bradyrhizobium diazoefficiens]|nr:hypothetical protein [Bradyrhizobium diazoefficiens]MBR0778555.1 hypothetical protein [Bradyrhizobium diazoefficiens]
MSVDDVLRHAIRQFGYAVWRHGDRYQIVDVLDGEEVERGLTGEEPTRWCEAFLEGKTGDVDATLARHRREIADLKQKDPDAPDQIDIDDTAQAYCAEHGITSREFCRRLKADDFISEMFLRARAHRINRLSKN